MAKNKVQRSFRLPPDVAKAVDQYAENNEITKSEAYRRVIKQGIEVQQSDVTVIQGTEQALPDGGQLEKTQSQVQEVSKDIDTLNRQLNNSILVLVVGILWIGLELTAGIPFEPVGTILTGLLLVLWALYPRVKQI
jgi:predicted transcriptional regulator